MALTGWRGLYRATNGALYGVCQSIVYYIPESWIPVRIGILSTSGTPVSMTDNGTTVLLVDGSSYGYEIDLGSNILSNVVDPNFLGGVLTALIDGFALTNVPDTNQFQSTLDNEMVWDGLFIAAKAGFPDKLAGLVAMHRELWLIGQLTTEIWYDAGNSPGQSFSIIPGVFIEQGCIAPYSIAKHDLKVFWLGVNRDGKAHVLMGTYYQAIPISTFAIEKEIASYGTITDAVGFCYQQEGHVFYVLTFPTADKTWCYDVSTQLWHEKVWTDSDGKPHMWRGSCSTFAYGVNVVGDWENTNLYQLDLDTYTDNGVPIVRVRGYPHLVNDGKRVNYAGFQADMEAGDFSPAGGVVPSILSLRWSDDRGRSYGNPVEQSLGNGGEYLTQPQWLRTGMARDRVFELSWALNCKTALNGAYIDVEPWGT